MIRALTRIILFVFLLLLAFMIFFIVEKVKFKKQITYGRLPDEEVLNTFESQKTIGKINKRIVYIMLASVFTVTLIFLYPFEGEFIRFDTPEDSLNYSVIDNALRKNTIIEGEGCYFVFSQKNNNVSYYTISKYDNKVGMVDYKSKSNYIGLNNEDRDLVMCHAVYDKNSNTSCYFVINNTLAGEKGDHVILINGKKATCIYKENIKGVYTLIEDGEFRNDVVITIDGVDIPILPMFQYMFGN